MDIKNIQEEKRKLESFILYELKKFENRTGVKIESVELLKLQTLTTNLGVKEVKIFCSI